MTQPRFMIRVVALVTLLLTTLGAGVPAAGARPDAAPYALTVNSAAHPGAQSPATGHLFVLSRDLRASTAPANAVRMLHARTGRRLHGTSIGDHGRWILLETAAGATGERVAFQHAWSATGSMHQGRFGHMAVLLRSGEVLVAGGIAVGMRSPLVTEIYNPATGIWHSTGQLLGPHSLATMTLLPDGLVLLAGGGASISAELYSPASGRWANVSMRVNRAFSTATLLVTGEVLVAGGTDTLFRPVASSELFDPGTRAWRFTGPMHTVRMFQTTTALPDGRVLTAGGMTGRTILASAELFDPRTGRWTPTKPLITARYSHIAQPLPDGRVLVAGGLGTPSVQTKTVPALVSAELFNPRTDSWSRTGAMPFNLSGTMGAPVSLVLKDGSVLVIGLDVHRLLRAALYSAQTGRWRPAAPLPAVGAGFTATLLSSGKVLIAGGLDRARPTGLAAAYLYSPE